MNSSAKLDTAVLAKMHCAVVHCRHRLLLFVITAITINILDKRITCGRL